MRILITGGPVHAHIDAVKIVTNVFKGGHMAALAESLAGHEYFYNVTYLTTKGATQPSTCGPKGRCRNLEIIHHSGFDDYMQKVLELAPKMDAVVLGAAVANLIPLNPIQGKFPSHDYLPGDVIPIEFTIAPRIIDKVKDVAPKTHLFGFKLLKDVPHEELVTAAYGLLLDSKATAMFANDATDLNQITMVTKERGEHPMNRGDIPAAISEFCHDEYYRTNVTNEDMTTDFNLRALVHKFEPVWQPVKEGYIFGTVALRHPDGGFQTTARGKNEIKSQVHVLNVDHGKKEVTASHKATLNAPLLDYIFEANEDVSAIVHLHCQIDGLPTMDYAPPGTIRDSCRHVTTSINIQNHGCFLLLRSISDTHIYTIKGIQDSNNDPMIVGSEQMYDLLKKNGAIHVLP